MFRNIFDEFIFMVSKRRPSNTDANFGNKERPLGAKSGE